MTTGEAPTFYWRLPADMASKPTVTNSIITMGATRPTLTTSLLLLQWSSPFGVSLVAEAG